MNPGIDIDLKKCDKEGLCVMVCWEGVLEQADKDSFPKVSLPEMCISCGHCVAVCPSSAITISEMDMENFQYTTEEMAIDSDNFLGFIRTRGDLEWFEAIRTEHENNGHIFFYEAPVHIVIHADLSNTACPREDATLASYQMMLMANTLGLGTCFISNFFENANRSKAIRDLLKVPEENQILMAFALGYPLIPFLRLIDRKKPEIQWLT
jgi:ferredoxin